MSRAILAAVVPAHPISSLPEIGIQVAGPCRWQVLGPTYFSGRWAIGSEPQSGRPGAWG